jgi:hypothetical protein
MNLKEFLLTEASAGQAFERGKELHDILMNSDSLENLKNAHMKTQKEAAKVFQQAIKLLKGLK